MQENRRLKEILELHGIVYNPDDEQFPRPSYQQQQYQRPNQMPSGGSNMSLPVRNYDEVGVDFVLASVSLHSSLEKEKRKNTRKALS